MNWSTSKREPMKNQKQRSGDEYKKTGRKGDKTQRGGKPRDWE